MVLDTGRRGVVVRGWDIGSTYCEFESQSVPMLFFHIFSIADMNTATYQGQGVS